VIVLNARHLKRLMTNTIGYNHDGRAHLGVAKETPAGRMTRKTPRADWNVISVPRLGGLHHRYNLAA